MAEGQSLVADLYQPWVRAVVLEEHDFRCETGAAQAVGQHREMLLDAADRRVIDELPDGGLAAGGECQTEPSRMPACFAHANFPPSVAVSLARCRPSTSRSGCRPIRG
jgi:hypothetical protein